MKADRLSPWDGMDLDALLGLDTVAPMHYRNRHGDPNENGRSYGGQLLGQAMMAASATVPANRAVTMMQFLFLQGALHDMPLDLHVSVLQDGKRFSSRQVRGSQGDGRVVLDAHVTFALPLASPSHTVATTAEETAESLPRLGDVPQVWGRRLMSLGAYDMNVKGCFDFRLADAERVFSRDEPRVRFWLRASIGSNSPRLHEGAFAYMSDWWVNYSSLGAHVGELAEEGRRIYIASLNHCIWFHRPFGVDQWLHFDTESARAENGRGLSIARIHDEHGAFVATVAQECLMTYANDRTIR